MSRSSAEATGNPEVEEPIADGVFEMQSRAGRIIRRIFAIGAAGAISGAVVGGLGGRIVMRISAIAAGDRAQGRLTDAGQRVGEITLGGTIELVIFGGILAGLLGAVVLVAADPWLPRSRRVRGLATGLLLLAVAGELIIDADNRDFRILDPASLNVIMFVTLFILFGLLFVPLADRIERRLEAGAGSTSAYGLVPFLLLGALLMIPVFGSLFSEGFCECEDPAVEVGLGLVVASLATTLTWAHEVRSGDRAPLWIRLAGRAGVAGAVAFGAIRLVGEIRTIL